MNKEQAIEKFTDIVKHQFINVECTGDILRVMDVEEYLDNNGYDWASDSLGEPGMCRNESSEHWESYDEEVEYMNEAEMTEILMAAINANK
jgi:hypothetical protein